MIHDILDGRVKDEQVRQKFVAADGTAKERDVLLDERDAIFRSTRHLFISDASETLVAASRKFAQEHNSGDVRRKFTTCETSVLTRFFLAHQDEQVAGGCWRDEGVYSWVVQAPRVGRSGPFLSLFCFLCLSLFTFLLKKTVLLFPFSLNPFFFFCFIQYSLHLDLVQQITDEFKIRALQDICMLEQDIARGETVQGKTVKNVDQIWTQVQAILLKGTPEGAKRNDLVRLIALVSMLEGFKEELLDSLVRGFFFLGFAHATIFLNFSPVLGEASATVSRRILCDPQLDSFEPEEKIKLFEFDYRCS